MKRHLLFIILLQCQILCAQDTSLFRFLPLSVGNIWVYSGSNYLPGSPCNGYSSWHDRYEITGTTVINSKTYFVYNYALVRTEGTCTRASRLFLYNLPIRIDSGSLNIYRAQNCNSLNEWLIDSLKAEFGDTSIICMDPWLVGNTDICGGTTFYNMCGSNREVKYYYVGPWECGYSQRYVKDIGLTYAFWHCASATFQLNLQGAVINGTVCGDTAMPVGIETISGGSPDEFRLEQNYPNPFNPVTKIKFDIPVAQINNLCSLIIYDVLGREVATLVNEELKSGTYEVEWDASNFPSGVYYYKLTAGDASTPLSMTETKKMVLIK